VEGRNVLVFREWSRARGLELEKDFTTPYRLTLYPIDMPLNIKNRKVGLIESTIKYINFMYVIFPFQNYCNLKFVLQIFTYFFTKLVYFVENR